MSRPTRAMVLAAGLGTRMRPLTDHLPKPLLAVGGRTLIDRTLDLAVEAGVRRAVVNLHHLAGKLREHLARRDTPEIVLSEELPVILDTGGGIARALPELGPDPFFTLNPDAIFLGPNPLEVLARHWRPGLGALLLLVPRSRARAYTRAGDFFLAAEGGPPCRRGLLPAAPFIYAGVQIITPEAFAGAPAGPFSLNLVWDRLLAAGRVAAVVYPGAWVDVGTPSGLAEAERALAETGA